MRHSVTIERPTSDKDAAGQPKARWVKHAERRAEIVRSPGREAFVAASRLAKVPTFFRLRYLEGVTAGMRLVHGEKIYDIKSAVDKDGLKRELEIVADELEATS
jgi:SPP1 family predicted phage head-tail adaptor